MRSSSASSSGREARARRNPRCVPPNFRGRSGMCRFITLERPSPQRPSAYASALARNVMAWTSRSGLVRTVTITGAVTHPSGTVPDVTLSITPDEPYGRAQAIPTGGPGPTLVGAPGPGRTL